MDFTKSSSYEVHTGTGYRYHEENKAIPTAVSGSDLNALNWELMSLIKGMGIAPKAFNKDDPASYTTVFQAIKKMAWGSPTAVAPNTYTKTESDKRYYSVPIALRDTDNLNDFVTEGDYARASNSNTELEKNYPIARAGLLEVRRWSVNATNLTGILQRYTTYLNIVYTRVLYDGVWCNWESYKSYGLGAAADVPSGVTGFDQLTKSGFYHHAEIEGVPEATGLGYDWETLCVGRDGGDAIQITHGVSNRLWFRARDNENFMQWEQFLTVQNFAKNCVQLSASNAVTNFPLGSCIMVVDGAFSSRPRNTQTAIIYLSTANTYQYTTTAGGAALDGTWACRGGTSTASIFQRVA